MAVYLREGCQITILPTNKTSFTRQWSKNATQTHHIDVNACCAMCVQTPSPQPILKMTVQIQGSILYCIKLRIRGTSSSFLPNRLLLIHMLEHVEQHPTLYIFRKTPFGMMNMRCIDDALRRWNVGEGHIRRTRSHHSPAKLT
jgi:hypothetical protein